MPPAGKSRGRVGFLRILSAVLGFALLAAVGVLAFRWSSSPSDARREPIPVTVGTAAFHIPPAFVRAGALPRPGSQERVDVALALPDFAPAASGGPDAALFVAILREDGVIDPSERVDRIYGRFLEPDIWSNPGGLLLRRFRAESPYADEELFISPPDGRDFAARCRRPASARSDAEGVGEACLWRFRIGGADVQVRFAPDLLPRWEAIAAGVRARIAEWRRP